jgi:hypothetical protein
VSAFGRASFLCCEDHFKGIGASERDRFGERLVVGDSAIGTIISILIS